MHTIHVLWGVPRSTSTAFEWMMRMRGDLTCFHEPYGEAWYRGEEALAPRRETDAAPRPGLRFADVTQSLLDAAKSGPVFSKDFAQYTDHLWTDEYLALFRHAFLIRHPARVLASMERSYAKGGITDPFLDQEIGFAQQRELFDRLTQRDGTPPPVVDSDDLLADPKTMVARYCEAIGVPFVESALTWTPGDRSEVLWYDNNDDVWHASLRDSDGLHASPRKPLPDVALLSDHSRAQYERFLPHYEHLHAHRLGAAEPASATG